MLNLFEKTTFACSKLVTEKYSTSFTLGIKTLDKKFHDPIFGIYGFVRFADEIVDTFHDFDKEELLETFKKDTYKAIESKISLNPILHSFQLVVNKYKIEKELIEAFLYSMEQDLNLKECEASEYEEYIYGSAEVVGLMCLRVFCEGNLALFEKLKDGAKSLGSAFQKVNFLRDMKSDYEDRGRFYFPNVNFTTFSEENKTDIEADIQKDFDDSLVAIQQLPSGAKRGVYLAYIYYLKLFKKIKKSNSTTILENRIRISDFTKFRLLAKTMFFSS